ncbi:hypothetical protein Tco_0018902 [Tanacetum coccineum]
MRLLPTHSNDPLFSGEDRLQLKELVKKLEKRNKSRTLGLKRLRNVGRSTQVVSSEDEGLGAQEDAFKQGRKIADLDADAEVTLVDEAQWRNDDYLMFDIGVFDEQEVEVEKTLIEIKAAKPKAVTTAATTTTTAVTRPKARGVVVQEPSEFTTTTSSSQTSQLSQAKDKGKAKMIVPEKPLKKKDQILIDEDIAKKLQAHLNAKLDEEEKLAKQREEDANIAEWDNVQAMIDADYELAARLQAQEQEELTVQEKSKLFVELMDKRKNHFARLRAEEQRRKPPTKAQRKNQMCTYLKNMAGFTHSQLKNNRFDEVQKAFDNTMCWIDSFVSMDSEVVKGGKEKDKGNVTRAEESSSKRAGIELEQERIKKQKIDDDQEEAEMKKHMEIVVDEEEIAVDAIPLATKPLIIVDWKIIKKGKMGYFQLIRADGSSRRPEEAYERVLWGDLKVMFEPDIESDVWRNLQGYNVIVWKLFSSSGVHFVRFQNMYIFMLVEKKYPLTPATITKMLNKKLQNDHWNEGRIVGIKRLHDDLGVNTAKITTVRRVSTVRRIKTRERIKMKIVYQDYLRDKHCLQDIKDMLLLLVQGKLKNLTIEERLALSVSLRMFTRSIVIKRHVEDLQLAYSNPRGFIYQNKDKKNRLMRIDELHKFSDGTLNDVRSALDDILKRIRMEQKDHEEPGKICWWETVRGRPSAARKDHMIYHMTSSS